MANFSKGSLISVSKLNELDTLITKRGLNDTLFKEWEKLKIDKSSLADELALIENSLEMPISNNKKMDNRLGNIANKINPFEFGEIEVARIISDSRNIHKFSDKNITVVLNSGYDNITYSINNNGTINYEGTSGYGFAVKFKLEDNLFAGEAYTFSVEGSDGAYRYQVYNKNGEQMGDEEEIHGPNFTFIHTSNVKYYIVEVLVAVGNGGNTQIPVEGILHPQLELGFEAIGWWQEYSDKLKVEKKYYNGIKKCVKKDITNIVLPSSFNNQTITAIGPEAFSECRDLSCMIVPEGYTYIGKLAFAGCENLYSIALPESLEKIDNEAFISTNLEGSYIGASFKYAGTQEQWDNIDKSDLSPMITVEYEFIEY